MKSKKNSKRENRWLKCRQQIRRTGILLMGMLLVSKSAYASEPTIVTGTRTLLAWAAGICTSFVSAFTIYKGSVAIYKYMNAQPEEKPKYKKEATEILIAAVVIATLGSTITFILAKYGA